MKKWKRLARESKGVLSGLSSIGRKRKCLINYTMDGEELSVEGLCKKAKVAERKVVEGTDGFGTTLNNGESLMCLSSRSTAAFELVDRTQ